MKTYCFDLDGTLCYTPDADYLSSKPIVARIAEVNRLGSLGHKIVILTARGSLTGTDWREFTETQLINWGLNFDELFCTKPYADYYVDDKGVSDVHFFGD